MKVTELAQGRVWIQEEDGSLTLGLTGPGVEDIGHVVHLDLPSEGEIFSGGDVLITITGSQGDLDVVLPASGVVVVVNEELKEGTEALVEDPLDSGWLLKFEADDKEELDDLLG